MKTILLILHIFCCSTIIKAQSDKDIINSRDTFNTKKNITYVFRTYWLKTLSSNFVSPSIDTPRIVNLLDSFFTGIEAKGHQLINQKFTFIITIYTIRAPWAMDLYYGIDITAKGLTKTEYERYFQTKQYTKDVKNKDIYTETWLPNQQLNIWLNKWHESFIRKLKRKKLIPI